ncbi:MAG: FHA domain-containing protein [Planctomycetaceae bacterium]|nr:FHA domain-containing protein [Planctomycetales bacterium]MCB9874893.1 FHA domain-containing protein [Planctomycetaceae bacterium]MCB9939160.1 FHA domain-containing protein [Planctomycetaceae bacterium]
MTLTFLQLDVPQKPFQSTELPVVIGRSEEVQVRVDCRWASRRHCEIDCINGVLVLRDLGSRYGTIVNGETVQEIVLNSGDEIGVGLHRFIVQWSSDPSNMEYESVKDLDAKAAHTFAR